MPVRLPRRSMMAMTVTAVAGCTGGGETPTPTASPANPAIGDLSQMGDLEVTSPAFEAGGPIPHKYGHDERNINPPLAIANVPSETAAMTLIMDDPDAVEPAGEVWLHWLVWNIPPSRTQIPAGWEPATATVGTNDFGNRAYDGPDPPDERHTYRFKLYALDTELDIPRSAGKRRVGEAMVDHRLAQTQLEGTFAP